MVLAGKNYLHCDWSTHNFLSNPIQVFPKRLRLQTVNNEREPPTHWNTQAVQYHHVLMKVN